MQPFCSEFCLAVLEKNPEWKAYVRLVESNRITQYNSLKEEGSEYMGSKWLQKTMIVVAKWK